MTVLDSYVLPRIGSVLLTRLTTADVEATYRELLVGGRMNGEGLAATTVVQIHRTVRRMLNDAVRWGLIRVNRAIGAHTPRAERRPLDIWMSEEIRSFLEATRRDRLWPLWMFALHSGMRRGGLAGLRWRDVGLDCMVFTDRHCVAYHPQRLTTLFSAACRNAGLSPNRLNDLRHTMASSALQAGIHPKVVQERLGHTRVKMTLDVYSHLGTGIQDSAAEELHRSMRLTGRSDRRSVSRSKRHPTHCSLLPGPEIPRKMSNRPPTAADERFVAAINEARRLSSSN